MARLPEIPFDITEQTLSTICEFDSVRWKAAMKYAKALIMSSDTFTEEFKDNHADQLAEKTLQVLIDKKSLEIRMYGDERLAAPARSTEMSLINMNAFEAYVAIVTEVQKAEQCPEFCYARKTSGYPFHYLFASAKQEILYKVLVYGQDADIRIEYFNDSYTKDQSGKIVTLLVVPETYSWEKFQGLLIKGRTRIAFIKEENASRKRYECLLTDIFGED